MPPARIDLPESIDASAARRIGETVHEAEIEVREDVMINLVEDPKENWSFGNGEMQYVP